MIHFCCLVYLAALEATNWQVALVCSVEFIGRSPTVCISLEKVSSPRLCTAVKGRRGRLSGSPSAEFNQ